MHKKVIILILMIFLLTGCVKLNHNPDDIISSVMSSKISSSNTVSSGYKFFKPLGVRQISDNDYNQIFNINGYDIYLYVDIISYYYKNILNYEDTNSYNYFYKRFNYNDIDGYVAINKNDSDYFVKVVYNYSKIEFYVDEENLDVSLAKSLIILNSIQYNDNLITNMIASNINSSMDITYQLEGPKGDGSSFSKYLNEYVPDDDEENTIELPTE